MAKSKDTTFAILLIILNWTFVEALQSLESSFDSFDYDGGTFWNMNLTEAKESFISGFGDERRNESTDQSIPESSSSFNFEEFQDMNTNANESRENVQFEGENESVLEPSKHQEIIFTLQRFIKSLNNMKDPNQKDSHGRSLLHHSILYRDYRLAFILINSGSDINAIDAFNNTPLQYSIQNQDLAMISLLTNNEARISSINWRSALDLKDRLVFAYIISKLPDLNILEDGFWNPLLLTAERGEEDLIEFLLVAGAVTNVRNKYGKSSIDLAIQNGHFGTLRLLANAGADLNDEDSSGHAPLIHAIFRSSIQFVIYLVENGASISKVDFAQRNVIHFSVLAMNPEIMEYLLTICCHTTNGTNPGLVNDLDSSGNSPLHLLVGKYIVHNYNEDIFKRLVESLVQGGANINQQNPMTGNTPAHIASEYGRTDIIKYMASMGQIKTSLFMSNNESNHIIHLAIENNNEELLELIVQESNPYEVLLVNLKGKWGFTPLHVAARGGFVRIIQTLLENGGRIEEESTNGSTPIDLAYQFNNVGAFKILLKEELSRAVKLSNMSHIQWCLRAGANVNDLDVSGRAALHHGAISNNYTVVNFILKQNNSNHRVKTRNGLLALHLSNFDSQVHYLLVNLELIDAIAAKSISRVKYAFTVGANSNYRDEEGWTPIHHAVIHRNLDILNYLVSLRAADINAKDTLHHMTPVHLAAAKGYLEELKILFSEGADMSAITLDGEKPIHLATLYSRLQILEYLLSSIVQIDPNEFDGQGNTPLHYSAEAGNLAIFKFLVDNSGDITIKNKFGNLPIHTAAWNGNVNIVWFMIQELGINENVVGWNGWTSLHFASQGKKKGYDSEENVERKLEDTVQFLMNSDRGPVHLASNDGALPVHIAAENGHYQIVDLFVHCCNISVNTVDDFGWSTLHYAAKGGDVRVFKLIYEAGANLTGRNNETNQAIHIAAQFGHLEILRYIGTDIGTENYYQTGKNGWTVLHFIGFANTQVTPASRLLACIDWLLNTSTMKSSLISSRGNQSGEQIIHVAASAGNIEIVEYLLVNLKILVNSTDNFKWTPLHYASDYGHLKAVKLLVQHGGNVQDTTIEGKSSFDLAVKNQHKGIVLYFLHQKLVDVDDTDKEGSSGGWSSLHYAAESGSLGMVETLIMEGGHVNKADHMGRKPLHIAAKHGFKNIVQLLIEFGSNVSDTDLNGWTPLHFIASSIGASGDRYFTAKYLLETGADYEAEDKEFGATPLHIAAKAGCTDIIEILISQYQMSPNRPDKFDWTPLHYAVFNNHMDTVVLLVESGGNLGLMNKDGHTPLDLARNNSRISIFLMSKLKKQTRTRFSRDLQDKISSGASNLGGNSFILLIFSNVKSVLVTLLGFLPKLTRLENSDISSKNSTSPTVNLVGKLKIDIHCQNFTRQENNSSLLNTCIFILSGDQNITENVDIETEEFINIIEKINSQALIEYVKTTTSEEKKKLIKIASKAKEKIDGEFKTQVENLVKIMEVEKHISKFKEVQEVIKSVSALSVLIESSKSQLNGNPFDGTLISPGELRKSILNAQPVTPSVNRTLNSVTQKFGVLSKTILAKDLITGAMRGNGKSTALMVGLVVGGKLNEFDKILGKPLKKSIIGTAKIVRTEIALIKAFGASKPATKAGTTFLSRAAKVFGPLIEGVRVGFSTYSLVNSVADFKSGNKDAIADIVGNVITIVTSVLIVGTQIKMALTAAAGLAGPIGIAIAVVVDVLASLAIGIFKAVRVVQSIDSIIKLSGQEKFAEGMNAFFGNKISSYLIKLANDKTMNEALVGEMLKFLEKTDDYRRLVTPTSESRIVYYNCREERPWYCVLFGCRYTVCDDRVESKVNRDSRVILTEKQDLYYERSQPNPPRGGSVFCSPGRRVKHYQFSKSTREKGYLCEGAIGVQIGNTKKKDTTLYDLGDGTDTVWGFESSENVFQVKSGIKDFRGGRMNDTFFIMSNGLHGSLNGNMGSNLLVISDDTCQGKRLTLNLPKQLMQGCGPYIHLQYFVPIIQEVGLDVNIHSMKRIMGRSKSPETIYVSCDTEYIDLSGGDDEIYIEESRCSSQNLVVKLRSEDKLFNKATGGEFTYIITGTHGRLDFDISQSHTTVVHQIIFERSIAWITKLEFNVNSQMLNVDRHTYSNGVDPTTSIHMRGSKDGYYEHPKIFTMLSSDTYEAEIKVSFDEGEIYVLHNLWNNRGFRQSYQIREGFKSQKNIFILEGGRWDVRGGQENDVFLVKSTNFHEVKIDGGGGQNTLKMNSFGGNEPLNIDMKSLQLSFEGKIIFKLKNINVIIGREKRPDIVTVNCDLVYVDGKGGSDSSQIYDEILIPSDLDCGNDHTLSIQVGPQTKVINEALAGRFNYIIDLEGMAGHYIDFNLDLESDVTHNVMFSFSIDEFGEIMLLPESDRIKFTLKSGETIEYDILEKSIPNDTENEGKIKNTNGKCGRNEDGENVASDTDDTEFSPHFMTSLSQGKTEVECHIQITEQSRINIVHLLESTTSITERKGFPSLQNIFILKDGSWNVSAGDQNDIFILESSMIRGQIHGKPGNQNSLVFRDSFGPNENLIIDLAQGQVFPGNLKISGIESLTGRLGKSDQVIASCGVTFIDTQGGSDAKNPDLIFFQNSTTANCHPSVHIMIYPYTKISNFASNGEFRYGIVAPGPIDFSSSFSPNVQHNFLFEFKSNEIEGVTFDPNLGVLFKLENCEYGPYKMKDLEYGEQYFSQPKLVTSDNVEIRISPDEGRHKFGVFHLHSNNTDIQHGIKFLRNIVNIEGNSNVDFEGGFEPDFFRLHGSSFIQGRIDAGPNFNSLLLDSSFVSSCPTIDIDLNKEELTYQSCSNNTVKIQGFPSVLGREDRADRIIPGCKTEYIDGRGGADSIEIQSIQNCSYSMKIIISEETKVASNNSVQGEFIYMINSPREFDIEFNDHSEYENVNHIFNINTTLNDIQSISFDQKSLQLRVSVQTENGGTLKSFVHRVKPLSEDEMMYTQPRFLTRDGAEIKISGAEAEFYLTMKAEVELPVADILETFPDIANRLNATIHVQSVLNEMIAIGNQGNLNILSNSPIMKTHLFGNGGENIFMIYPSIDDVLIYAFPSNMLNTLDLTQLVRPVREMTSSKYIPKVEQNGQNLVIRFEEMNIILVGGMDWYQNLKFVLNSAMMELNFENLPSRRQKRDTGVNVVDDHEFWTIVPTPINIQSEYPVVMLAEEDIEIGTEIIWGDGQSSVFEFGEENGDLILTNSLNLETGNQRPFQTLIMAGVSNANFQDVQISFPDKRINLTQMIEEKPETIIRNFTQMKENFKSNIEHEVFVESFIHKDSKMYFGRKSSASVHVRNISQREKVAQDKALDQLNSSPFGRNYNRNRKYRFGHSGGSKSSFAFENILSSRNDGSSHFGGGW